MSYQVLARKWRPRDFDSLVGQEHVVRALTNALEQQRLHHAYLFTGTRGVGKTTLARILAKCLNCEAGVSARPCGSCSACVEIDEGRFIDLIEVDAASRTKVEDTRELLENVQYAPTRGRYKIYLIDEVHMLSTHSFNALLKTLEEPPPHVKFLLATTDPQKLPVTVLSRCLQFHLRPMPASAISDYLARVLESEGVAAEAEGLARIARAASGSMRDALSLVDQAVAFGEGSISAADVADMLGDVPRERVYELLDKLADRDAEALLQQVDSLAQSITDFAGVLDDLAGALQRLAVQGSVPGTRVDDPLEQQRLDNLVERFSAEDVQLFYQIALIGKRDLPLAPDPRAGFEMVMLRMHAFRPVTSPEDATGSTPTPARAPAAAKPASSAAAPQPTPASDSQADGINGKWHDLLASLQLQGLVQELAANCELVDLDERQVALRLTPGHENLLSEQLQTRLEQALRNVLNDEVRLRIEVLETSAETPAERRLRENDERHQQAHEAIAADPVVQSLQQRFDARIDPASVRPADHETRENR